MSCNAAVNKSGYANILFSSGGSQKWKVNKRTKRIFKNLGLGEVTQELKAPADKPADLHSPPRTDFMRELTDSCKLRNAP